MYVYSSMNADISFDNQCDVCVKGLFQVHHFISYREIKFRTCVSLHSPSKYLLHIFYLFEIANVYNWKTVLFYLFFLSVVKSMKANWKHHELTTLFSYNYYFTQAAVLFNECWWRVDCYHYASIEAFYIDYFETLYHQRK